MATKAIVGEKVGMTQVWDDENRVVPVTVLRVKPCRVVQVKTDEHDGYSALQVTFGTMKRHGFGGLPASHGAHRVHRAPGSIGACATPSRVFRGTRMSGRMGGEKVTTLNLTVVQADAERDLVLVRSSVPGPKGGLVLIRDAVKAGA